jgi:hypothetical protein
MCTEPSSFVSIPGYVQGVGDSLQFFFSFSADTSAGQEPLTREHLRRGRLCTMDHQIMVD